MLFRDSSRFAFRFRLLPLPIFHPLLNPFSAPVPLPKPCYFMKDKSPKDGENHPRRKCGPTEIPPGIGVFVV